MHEGLELLTMATLLIAHPTPACPGEDGRRNSGKGAYAPHPDLFEWSL